MRTKRQRDDDDDDAFENGVLKDGGRYRVPMRAMDSLQRDVARHFANLNNRRPSVYDEYDTEIGSRWQTPPTGADSHGLAGARVGGVCTVKEGGGKYGPEGAPGHWRLVDDDLVCVADFRAHDYSTIDRKSLMEPIYNDYDADLRGQWRRSR
jgi:hypothetical protein